MQIKELIAKLQELVEENVLDDEDEIFVVSKNSKGILEEREVTEVDMFDDMPAIFIYED